MTEREFVVTRKSENGSCVVIPDEKDIEKLSVSEIKTMVINMAIEQDLSLIHISEPTRPY